MVATAGKTILLVDDEPDIIESLACLLEGRIADVAIHTAADGEEALEWLAQNTADVIVSDYRMPGLTGLEFLDEAMKRHGRQNAVLLTAFDERRRAIDAARQGLIQRFFMKPPNVPELVAGIEELLRPEGLSATAG